MKQTVEFKGTRAQKEKRALEITKSYLGSASYLQIRRKIVDYCMSMLGSSDGTRTKQYRAVRFSMAMVGVAGYWPHRAVARDVLRIVADARKQQGK